MELVPAQKKVAKKLAKKIKRYNIAILSGEVRSGKTLPFLKAADILKAKRPLVITQKNAIKGIQAQAHALGVPAVVINFHQVKNLTIDPDLIIIDESHRWVAGYPKPSTLWKEIKPICIGKPIIFSSGTLTPEGFSGLFNMLALSDNTPWRSYTSFNAWFYGHSIWENVNTGKKMAFDIGYSPTGRNVSLLKHVRDVTKSYGRPYKKKINGYDIPQHDRTKERMILEDVAPFTVTLTREDTGHKHEAVDVQVRVPLSKKQKKMYIKLEDKKVIPKLDLLADTPAKMMQKLHQIAGGFVINEEGDVITLKENPKLDWLKKNIDQDDTVIVANYRAEQQALAKLFPHTGSVTKLAEGVDFSHFGTMVIYSMGFSAATYQQIRARQMNISRDKPINVIFLISGIDQYVYKAVQAKHSFTAAWYRKNKGIERWED